MGFTWSREEKGVWVFPDPNWNRNLSEVKHARNALCPPLMGGEQHTLDTKSYETEHSYRHIPISFPLNGFQSMKAKTKLWECNEGSNRVVPKDLLSHLEGLQMTRETRPIQVSNFGKLFNWKFSTQHKKCADILEGITQTMELPVQDGDFFVIFGEKYVIAP